jgi:pimeloyl-ACP methyl ester carboxylesterase
MVFQKNFIYAPSDQDFDACPHFTESEKINVNGTRVYYVKRDAQHVVILYHGNGGSACDRAYWKDFVEPTNSSLMIVEYAGYSNDDANPSMELILKDVERVHDFVNAEGFTDVVAAGESLGTSLAIYHSTLGDMARLLLISPFYSLNSVAQGMYPMYPISLLSTQNFDSSGWMRKTQARKVMMIHGSEDEMHPIVEAKKLFSEIGVADKEFVEVPGAHHNDIYDFDETVRSIRAILLE